MTNSNQNRTIPETGYLRLPQILEVFPIAKSTWWAGVKSGKYPQGIKLGPKTTAWRVEEIRELLASFEQQNVQEG